jgi:hypothetical protein
MNWTIIKYILLLAILVATPTYAIKNYSSNILSPIPPGCATNYQLWDDFNPSQTETIYNGSYPGTNLLDGSEHVMEVRVWRKGCPNSDRSVIMMDMTPATDNDGDTECLATPMTDGKLPNGSIKHMRATLEPHTNFQFDNLRLICEGNSMTFFIETISIFDGRVSLDNVMTPIEYNNAWSLILEDPLTGRWTFEIPAYSGNLSVNRMALTGRLSGTWVVAGVSDQGFVMAFEELTDTTQGLLFLSWYTYDSNGKLLWLTGAGLYEWGDTEVSLDIELVENGTFMGAKTADRRVVGTARVVALNCNNLQLTYNLNTLGLGAATKTMVRIFSAETQGYACSDLQTRLIHEGDG